jgi:hypothetical protein
MLAHAEAVADQNRLIADWMTNMHQSFTEIINKLGRLG